MQGELVVVFGGSGFLGKQIVRALAKAGARVRVPMRRPHLGADLRVMGGVGQIQLVQANLRFSDSVARALEGADAVVNCVGLLHEKGTQNFSELHVKGAEAIADAAAARGITRFVHVSAIGAGAKAKSRYWRTKGEAEDYIRAKVPTATILRPSIIFGPEDSFFNRFADMAKFMPVMPLIGGRTKLQPAYVGDVAKGVLAALGRIDARGRTYELGGPRVYTMRELIAFTLKQAARPRFLFPVPLFIAQIKGMLLDAIFKLNPFAGPPLTGDQVAMLRKDNVAGADMPGFAALGVGELETIEAVAPSYLWRFRPHGQFEAEPA
ncbi:MAG: complex I NDUFA9 subunit family protein [Hyphomonadaceae bacterium]|nr:complex I NDUFA9 subunit family protein [Hyphomonadaceae bacterium]